MTIRNTPSSLKFSQIVADAISPHLAPLGFRLKPLFDPQKHQIVSFVRERAGRHEEIWIGRKLYDADDPTLSDAGVQDEVESIENSPRVLASRHLFYASVIADGVIADIPPTKNVEPIGSRGHYWRFADEFDLQHQLEQIIPFVQVCCWKELSAQEIASQEMGGEAG